MAAMGATNLVHHSVMAGLFGTLQALLYATMNFLPTLFYFDSYSDDDKLSTWFTVNFIQDIKQGLKALLVTMVLLNVFWVASSLTLVIYSNSKSPCLVRQWVVITTITIVTSLIGSSYFLFQAVPELDDHLAVGNLTGATNATRSYVNNQKETGQFIYLYVGLSNGTILFWILNIIFCIYVHKRAKELEEQAKIKPGFGAEAFGSNLSHQASRSRSASPRSNQQDGSSNGRFHDHGEPEGPASLNRGYRDTGRDLREGYRNGASQSPYLERENRFNQYNGGNPRLGVPMAHLGVSPFKGGSAPASPAYPENDDEGYDERFGSPPSNIDDSEDGGGNPNFVMKRKSLYNYENNPSEIQSRMSKLEISDSTRRPERPNSMADKLKPPIYQATAFEPHGRNKSNHAPLARTSGTGRESGYNNFGFASADDDVGGSQRRAQEDFRGPQRPAQEGFREPPRQGYDDFRGTPRPLRPAQDQVRGPLRPLNDDIRASQRRADDEIRDFHQRRLSSTPDKRAYDYDRERMENFQRSPPIAERYDDPREQRQGAPRYPDNQDTRGQFDDGYPSQRNYTDARGYETNRDNDNDYRNHRVSSSRRY